MELNGLGRELDELDLAGKHRAVTGVLASHPEGRDVHINNASITFHGAEMLVDSQIRLNVGCRYGLIGPNGCGWCLMLNLSGGDFTLERRFPVVTSSVFER